MAAISNPRILEALKCPVCYDVLHPPIHRCDNGHSTCGDCWSRMRAVSGAQPRCPLCRGDFQEEPNQVLEVVYDLLQVPCKNSGEGCQVVCFGRVMRVHSRKCLFRATRCPRRDLNCPWEGPLTMLTKHIVENHV